MTVSVCCQECEGDHYQVNVHMSASQFKYLEDYVSQKQNTTAEVHSILSSMLRDFRLADVFLALQYKTEKTSANLQ